MGKDPNDFGPYENYLDLAVWPSERGYGEVEHIAITRDEMSPNQAASCLAKLVRWARMEPRGQIALHPDEDSREVAVRSTTLGTALAARACNLDEEHFYALYGEIGALPDADLHEVLAEIVVGLGDNGLGDWSWQDRITISAKLLNILDAKFAIKEKRQ